MWDRLKKNSIFLADWTLSNQILDYSDGNTMTGVALTKGQVGSLRAMMEGAMTMDSMKHIVERRKGCGTSGDEGTLGRLSGVYSGEPISNTIVNTRDLFDSEGVTLQENAP